MLLSQPHTRILLAALALIAATAATAFAQERRVAPGTPLPDYARVFHVPEGSRDDIPLVENGLPNILLIGYWPPTNEMIRHFNPFPEHNPDGWVGENWQNRGYNIYALFPEFPGGLGQGVGDFEVDYQDTSLDFWDYTDQIKPIGMIGFGRSGYDKDYEFEERHRNRPSWGNDYTAPYLPTPNPPDDSVPSWTIRYSSLPMAAMVLALELAPYDVNPFVATDYGGDFLCEYLGYHICWYHDLHTGLSDPQRCIAAGFIHLGYQMDLEDAIGATEITVGMLTSYLNNFLFRPGDLNCDGELGFDDINPFVLALSGAEPYDAAYPACTRENADCNEDGIVGFDDINPFVLMLSGG